MRRPFPVLLIAGSLGLYLLFGLAWISLPGPEHDEVLFLNASFPLSPVSWYVAEVRVFGQQVPSMLMPYLGTLKGLLWRVVFLLWEPSIASVRAPAVLLGGAALLLFYLWARRFYEPGTALAAVALAASDPTYIYTARLDWGPVVLQHLFCFAGLLLGGGWLQRDRGRLGYLAGAGLCFGLGLWDKATFGWFLLALAATLCLLFPRRVLARLRPAPLAVFLVCFVAGAFPFFRYNLRTGGTRQVAQFEPAERAVFESKFLHLRTTLDGRFVYRWTGGQVMDAHVAYSVSDRPQLLLDALAWLGPSWGTLFPWAVAGALLVAAVAAGARRPILFPLLVSALMWVEMLPIKGAGSGHHVALTYPFPHLAVAAAGSWLWSRARLWGRRALGAALAALLLTQIGWDARYLQAFRQTGGLWNWTDAIYEIARYLDTAKPDLVVNMDWGFTYPLMLLSRVPQQDFWGEVSFKKPADEGPYVRKVILLLEEPRALFLFHTEAYENFSEARKLFQRALDLSGKHARIVRTFYQRTGDPVAYLAAAEAGAAPREILGGPVRLSFLPTEVRPGDQYRITCRELAGKVIDLRYAYRGGPPDVAHRFCILDKSGSAAIRVPTPFDPGTIEVLAVRVAGTLEWRPADAKLTVR